jgi:hypothetical protein
MDAHARHAARLFTGLGYYRHTTLHLLPIAWIGMWALLRTIRGMSIVQRCNTMLAPRLPPPPPLPPLPPVESSRAGRPWRAGSLLY